MPSLELTERDEVFMKMLASYRVMPLESAGVIYQTNYYHYNRLSRLSNAKYINRKDGAVLLGAAGRKYLQSIGVNIDTIHLTKQVKERRLKIAEIGVSFLYSDTEFIPSWEVKKQYNLNKGMRLMGILQSKKDVDLIVVYNIGKKPSSKKINKIKNELKKFPALDIRRAVIFAEDKTAMDAFAVEPLGLDEQLLLPYTDFSIELLKAYAKEDLRYKSAQIALGKVYPSSWASADYTDAEGRAVVVLTLNDIEKRARLESYYKFAAYRHTGIQEIVVVCLESQRELFLDEFPKAEIISVSEDDIIN